MPVLGRLALTLLAVGLLLVLDMRTKSWAGGALRASGGRTVAAGQVRLRYYENPGMAFGLLREQRGARQGRALAALSVAATVVPAGLLAWLMIRRRRRLRVAGYLAMAGLAVLLGGSLGNLHDRLERGYVVDFIDVSAGGWIRWPIFNVADMAITLGGALCLAAFIQAWVRQMRRARAGLVLDDDEDEEALHTPFDDQSAMVAAEAAGDSGAMVTR